ncbi:addiction module protein [Aetokthonos hydrillicola Thurmond2011]|jgi:putative addiction module component (TIGR02574 family)|uniref:Addiction module protein n=1 Tax=Aetokthonos hydrillicola Thurmond2011 TaxID=2712845 RepID=A0AAP5IF82_9CYAN|nr:addiction module protein [Aetokthonos hydrillicola]MBO3457235.1 addiction module protein [Aetokthonos hydrillicola CCALA 1050]MBW4587585.1 addiction module protein [Aetokthonos hydrillicola CCALA 1050]MDR9900149.1 addiction module protein [Aetokthonos hydrillicola Thurmond2011]
MYSTYDDIFDAALSLPPGLRAMLAEHLFKSLDAETQAEVDSIWASEAEARLRDIEEGKVVTIPGDQVFKKLRTRRK